MIDFETVPLYRKIPGFSSTIWMKIKSAVLNSTSKSHDSRF